MTIKIFKCTLYLVMVILGCLLSFFKLNGFQYKSKKNAVADYIYKGHSTEKLNFKEYHKGLFLSDSTVLKHKEGMLATPKVAGEVAFAIFEDVYSYDLAKFNYPYHIYKTVYSWNIYGTCSYNMKKEEFYFGVGLNTYIQRSNGMVTFMERII